MELWEALVLGLVQGLSEFLPVSSTAHVTLAGYALGTVDDPARWTAFLAVVQLGTLVAVIAYFWRELVGMTRDVVLHRPTPERRMGWLLVLGTLPIAIVGLALRDIIEGPWTKDLRVIAGALALFALVLWLAERAGRRERGLADVRARDALIVGAAQVFSLVPGASRSGVSLAGGLFAGFDRVSAARFSFLLSIPAIAASGLFELPLALAADESAIALLVATAAAALSGYAAIWALLRHLQRRNTGIFIAYRLALAAAILTLLASGTIAPR